jgi:hypothetical protein
MAVEGFFYSYCSTSTLSECREYIYTVSSILEASSKFQSMRNDSMRLCVNLMIVGRASYHNKKDVISDSHGSTYERSRAL